MVVAVILCVVQMLISHFNCNNKRGVSQSDCQWSINPISTVYYSFKLTNLQYFITLCRFPHIIMKYFFILIAVLLLTEVVALSSFSGNALNTNARNIAVTTMEYIPSGVSKEQWKKMKETEKQKQAKKNLGKVGITTFKSRSFSDWQAAGGINLFPVDPKSVKDLKDIPYM